MGKRGPDQRKSDTAVLRAVLLARGPVATAAEIADELDYSRQNVSRILKKLRDNDLVRSKEVGARAVVWWTTNDGQRAVASESTDSSE